jgi:hypothetical protein
MIKSSANAAVAALMHPFETAQLDIVNLKEQHHSQQMLVQQSIETVSTHSQQLHAAMSRIDRLESMDAKLDQILLSTQAAHSGTKRPKNNGEGPAV